VSDYLTEDILEQRLKETYPNYEFIRDKIVPNSGIKNRPDFRNDELKLIYEFDGYSHYSDPKVILSDYKKYEVYKNMGYKIIRYPYFIQPEGSNYKHGFIDKKAMLPAYFCELGIKRFLNDMKCAEFNYARRDVINSLYEKETELKDINLVLPPSLQNPFWRTDGL